MPAQSSADQMRWLLRFAEMELSALPLPDLSDLGRTVLAIHAEEAAGIEWDENVSGMALEVLAGDESTFPRYTRRALDALQHDIKVGLRSLANGKRWVLPEAPKELWVTPAARDVLERDTGRATDKSRYVARRYSGSFRAAFCAAMADLLVEHWQDVRTCAAPTCGHLFLPEDPRQRYCSPECSRRTRWDAFKPKRKRDYKEEYRQRVKKLHGPTVKPRHRR